MTGTARLAEVSRRRSKGEVPKDAARVGATWGRRALGSRARSERDSRVLTGLPMKQLARQLQRASTQTCETAEISRAQAICRTRTANNNNNDNDTDANNDSNNKSSNDNDNDDNDNNDKVNKITNIIIIIMIIIPEGGAEAPDAPRRCGIHGRGDGGARGEEEEDTGAPPLREGGEGATPRRANSRSHASFYVLNNQFYFSLYTRFFSLAKTNICMLRCCICCFLSSFCSNKATCWCPRMLAYVIVIRGHGVTGVRAQNNQIPI